ncbi:hypothetical protein O181_066549 [Austropuccinia psidii MF-1]|uniref:Uncharacterized protein n=1 Tax=Austropuccinia psidii MF-1 TaxID=1389203 RepID=A0A9Q3ETN7_9BASI|nr:hypothetical protein [Austropuccinia psidii MF-1]
MSMARGNSSLGQLSPCLVTHGIQMPNFPHEKTPQKLTPGPSGTQQSEDLFCSKQPNIPLLISTFDSSDLNLPPFVEPSHPNEPSIPGPSQSSKPHEDAPTHDPEAEVALTQSMEEPFDKSSLHFFYSSQLFLTPPSTISSSSRYTPLCNHH